MATIHITKRLIITIKMRKFRIRIRSGYLIIGPGFNL